MSHVNVGAYVNGVRPPTKKALREALASAPETVTFDPTARHGSRSLETEIKATVEMIGADKFEVCGPDPFTKRSWYATVEVRNGALRLT